MSAIVADAIPRELTAEALACMPPERLQRLSLDLADVWDRIEAVLKLRGIRFENVTL
jgi:hypothetical protein